MEPIYNNTVNYLQQLQLVPNWSIGIVALVLIIFSIILAMSYVKASYYREEIFQLGEQLSDSDISINKYREQVHRKEAVLLTLQGENKKLRDAISNSVDNTSRAIKVVEDKKEEVKNKSTAKIARSGPSRRNDSKSLEDLPKISKSSGRQPKK